MKQNCLDISTSNIPELFLWEIYIEPFYKADKKGDVTSVMESYNAINVIFMKENKRLLQDILKDKIGFKGFIISDWWAINRNSSSHFANGSDIKMPGEPDIPSGNTGVERSDWYQIPNWIKNKNITEERLDHAVIRSI